MDPTCDASATLVGIVPSLGKRYLDSFLVMRMGIVGSLIGIQRD
jgi:hypothetical protein